MHELQGREVQSVEWERVMLLKIFFKATRSQWSWQRDQRGIKLRKQRR